MPRNVINNFVPVKLLCPESFPYDIFQWPAAIFDANILLSYDTGAMKNSLFL